VRQTRSRLCRKTTIWREVASPDERTPTARDKHCRAKLGASCGLVRYTLGSNARTFRLRLILFAASVALSPRRGGGFAS